MSNDKFILSEWEKEKMDYLKEMARGFDQGIASRNKEIVLNMYNKKYTLEEISDITNLSLEEIQKIISEI